MLIEHQKPRNAKTGPFSTLYIRVIQATHIIRIGQSCKAQGKCTHSVLVINSSKFASMIQGYLCKLATSLGHILQV